MLTAAAPESHCSPYRCRRSVRYSVLLPKFIYFSFITLATQGYGNITPQGSVPETIVIFETIIGQFYVALVLAYLLSVHITQRMKEK